MNRPIRASVDYVRAKFPMGCTLRHKASGALFTMGVKAGMSNFWLMQHEPSRKGVISATAIEAEYEKVGG